MLFHQLHACEERLADLTPDLEPFTVTISDVFLQVHHVRANFSTVGANYLLFHRALAR